MPTLDWLGKAAVVNHHYDVPFHFLDRKYGSSDENMIVCGDNLIVLKSLLPRFEGRIKCIYIDPPYNTGNEGWVYNDAVNDPQIKKWLGEVVGREGEDFTRHDKWLCMMYPRLRLMQRLLSEDGAIFISIDDNEQANLKLVCDEIFGANNFLAMLTRRCMHTVRNSSKDFNKNSDFILTYAKDQSRLTSDKAHRIREQTDKAGAYRFNDGDGRGFYKLDPIYARNYAKPYTFTFKNGVVWTAPEGSYPRYSIETLILMEDRNQIDFNGKHPRAKRYLNEVQQGQPPDTFLKEEKVGFNSDGTKTLAQVLGIDKAFNQPKPVQLIEYLIGILPDNKNIIVLDAFAGSGTTAHAVLNLNKSEERPPFASKCRRVAAKLSSPPAPSKKSSTCSIGTTKSRCGSCRQRQSSLKRSTPSITPSTPIAAASTSTSNRASQSAPRSNASTDKTFHCRTSAINCRSSCCHMTRFAEARKV